MKKIFMFLLLFCMPIVSFGLEDACTNPNEFTIDKRCYVTDEQKQQKPYNAVVGFIGPYGTDCTGTVVKHGEQVFVYTAKHCMERYKERFVSFVDETQARVGRFSEGNYKTSYSLYEQTMTNADGDWAILKFDEADTKEMPFVELSVHPTNRNALSLGYGGLKVMSDKEIADIKNKYIDYWKNNDSPYVIKDENTGEYVPEGKILITQENQAQYGLVDGGLVTINSYVGHFISKEIGLLDTDSHKLKASYCQYDSDSNKVIGCQGWQGDSGGGLFDFEGNLMAIRSKGSAIIGGTNHASNQDADGYVSIDRIKEAE